MSLSPSTRLGPYEILSRLGAGGMGEVYRARDTRLGRDVAIKILPGDLSGDPSRRARFEQEARAVAALNHPNILGLYDIGGQDGTDYMVTEFVAGETLAALMERGPIATRKLLDIAVEIADGMAAAHAARITHRDLKPLNIMIDRDGRVKILDFGLAKQAPPASADADETMTAAQTQPGMIMGTVNYMSPEQVRGQPADHRSDQFSFGLILYEMAGGRKPFDRPDTIQTMSAILTDDPPPIERVIPAPLRWAIDRCLAKDATGRYESSRDLFHELRSLRDHLSETSTTTQAAAPTVAVAPTAVARRPIPWTLAAAFALGVLATFAALWLMAGPEIPDQSAYRFVPLSFAPGGQSDLVWSPDSKAVAYAAREASGPWQVFLRYLDSPTPIQLTHTAESSSPVSWSPDGKRIFLRVDRKPRAIWSVATVGGEPEMAAALPEGLVTGALSPDHKVGAALRRGGDGIYTVWHGSVPSGPFQRYSPDPFATRAFYNYPGLAFSPDGTQILLLLNGAQDREEAWLLPYPPNPSHPPRLVLQGLPSYEGTPDFSWMPDSRHVVVAIKTSREAATQLWMADTRSQERHALTSGTTTSISPVVSPDGRRIAFTELTRIFDVLSVDLATAAVHPLVLTERDESMPAWASKKPALAFVTDRNGPQELWLHVDGSPDRPLVTARDFPPDTTQWFMGPALSPEADRVVYTRVETQGGGAHLWISALAGGAPVPLTNDSVSTEYPGSWSPDGNWFAYLSMRNDHWSLMKAKASGQAVPIAVKADADRTNDAVPCWSLAGDWIVYGENLYSPDGATVKPLGNQARGVRVRTGWQARLWHACRGRPRIALLGGHCHRAGKNPRRRRQNFRPASNLNPAIRFSLAPDGKSFVYSSPRSASNLWILEGFAAKTGLFARLGLR